VILLRRSSPVLTWPAVELTSDTGMVVMRDEYLYYYIVRHDKPGIYYTGV
jgi:hypothetical protein